MAPSKEERSSDEHREATEATAQIMSFDLNSSSSSSSSDRENLIKLRRAARDSDDDDTDIHQQIDEELVESIRNALHLAVGNICREQDAASAAAAAESSNNTSSVMSNEAIAALTDLVSVSCCM
jgi:hypothetical protein